MKYGGVLTQLEPGAVALQLLLQRIEDGQAGVDGGRSRGERGGEDGGEEERHGGDRRA
jgi:hypothetical protein